MANEAIKDIYIRYGADTSNFSKGQKAVNKELYSNQKAASALDRQFKETFDPSDIQPLIKQQTYLTKALQASQDKASMLQHELDSINKEADDFDPAAYARLETILANTNTNSAKLNKQLDKVDQNIKAIETGNLDEMSDDFKRAAKSAGEMNDELEETSKIDLSGTYENINSMDTSMSGLLTTALKLPGPLKAVGAGIVGIGAAALGAEKNSNMLNTMMINLSTTADAMGVPLQNAVDSTNELYVATGDLEGATAATNTAMAIYGDTLNTTAGLTAASASIYMTTANGILDIADASKIGSSAQTDFGASTLEANAAIAASEELMAKYPGQVDDIGDSMKEFGGTISGVGFDLNEFFTVMNVGMELGAKNTDIMVNAINEMILRTAEMSEESKIAFEALGIGSEQAKQMINDNLGPELFAETIFALNDMTDANLQATYAAALFGTAGEEFVLPMLQTQKEALNQLETAYDLNNAATSRLAEVQKGEMVPAIMETATTMGFSQTQAENLAFVYEQGGLAALSFGQKIIVLAAGLAINGKAMGLTNEQGAMMKDTLTVLTDSTATTSEKFASLTGELAKFLFGGVLTTEQTALLTENINAQKLALDQQLTSLVSNTLASDTFTTALFNQASQLGANNVGMSEASFAALDYKGKIDALTASEVLTTESASVLTTQLGILTDSESTTAEKAGALRTTVEELRTAGFEPTRIAAGSFEDSLWSQAEALGFTTEETDKAAWASADLSDKSYALAEAMGLSRNDTREFATAVGNLTSEYTTNEEKTEALKEILQTLSEEGFQVNLDKLSKLVPKYQTLSRDMDGSVISSNKLTGEFAGQGRALDTTSGDLKEYSRKLEDSLSPAERARKKGRELEDQLYGTGDAANYAAGEISDLNTEMSENSTLPPPQSAPSSSSRSIPTIGQLTMPNIGTPVQNTTTNQTTFAPNIYLQGGGITQKDVKLIKDAMEDFWDEKGRLL